MDNLNPPTVLILPNVVDFNESVRLDSLFRVTDADLNSEITTIQFRDNSGSGGFFTQNGTILTPTSGVFHTIDADELGNIRYVGGNSVGTESINVRVSDGTFFSNTAFGLITTGNSRPVVTGTDTVVQAGSTINISDLINFSDADNNPDRFYFIVDRSIGANGGQLAIRNETELINPQATFLQVDASDLSQLQYDAPTVDGESETISIQVFDGFAFSELADFTITTSIQPQVIDNGLQELVTNERRAAADLFSLDADTEAANPIQSYFFVDRRINATGGFFEFQGERQASGEFFFVEADELDQLFYVGASVGNDLENIGIVTFNGFEFGDAQDIEVLTLPGPVIAAETRTVRAGHFLNFATGGTANTGGTVPEGDEPILDFLDASGDAIREFLFVDRLTNGGHFVFRGEQVPSAVWFRVPVEELDQVEYVGAQTGPTSEQIGVFVNTNFIWNDLGDFTIETIPNLNAPVVTAPDLNVRPDTVLPLDSLFGFTDVEGDSLQSITFSDSDDDPVTGFFTVNGVQQSQGDPITIPGNQIGTVNFVAPSGIVSEDIQISVNDGLLDSNVATATISTIGLPTIAANDNDIQLDTIERVNLVGLVPQTDPGPNATRFQVFDENTANRSGGLELDGVELQNGVVHDLTVAEFNRLVVRGAEVDMGRQLDPILVRANNGVEGFSEWERINVNTDPVGSAAINTGALILNNDPGSPSTTITFSFIDGANQNGNAGNSGAPIPDYYDPMSPEAGATILALSQEQRETFREVFDFFESVANVEFVELAYNPVTDPVNLAANPEIVIGSFDFPAAGLGGPFNAFAPATGDGRGLTDSDIFFDITTSDYSPNSPTDVSLGSGYRDDVYSAVATALGLGDPTQATIPLSIFNNFDYLTVLSQQHDSGFNRFAPFPEQPSSLALFDIEELQNIYGANTTFNIGDNQYGNFFSGSAPHFINNNESHQTTLYDAGGNDTLNYTLHVADETIDLRQGQFSSINGVPQSLRLSYGTIIENARGGSGDDDIRGNETVNFLIGNEGDDVLRGGGGNDVLRGGEGDDTFVWSLGDGRDLVQEQGAGGLDTLQVFDPSGSLTSLADDLTFRRFGNDLRIDFTLNQGEGQGTVTIQDFGDEESRVEFLTLHDSSGTQIGNTVDLQSIFDQATTLAQRFTVGTELADTLETTPGGGINENAFAAIAVG